MPATTTIANFVDLGVMGRPDMNGASHSSAGVGRSQKKLYLILSLLPHPSKFINH
jgi:hypothetical protein